MSFLKKLQKLRSIGIIKAVKIVIKRYLSFYKIKLRDFWFGPAFTFFEKLGLHVLPVHYYSPVPDTRELRKNFRRWYTESNLAGIDLNLQGQTEFLKNLKTYQIEYDHLPSLAQITAQGFGEGYGEVEAHLLHATVRYFKPRLIIEVGSGVSTFYMANALTLNRQETGSTPNMVCIEPYHHQALKRIQGDCHIEIIPKFVQEVGLDVFETLNKRDILFIDSSHIVRIGSDVTFLYLEILPRLKNGVIIHIHDIFFPYPTPPPESWIFNRHMFFSEPALLQAMLMYNSTFKILLCASYLHYKMPESLSSAFTIYNPAKHLPSSIWLQKVG
ncbi:MAG: class I SAM-dependent methyltransferase [Anaerolineae bacterium]|nr:class I SAM-dependent methyltransferase [Anaerolineae bacterium]